MKFFLFILCLFVLGVDHRPVKKRIVLKTNKLKRNWKIAHISDFHSGKSLKIVDWIKAEHCDLILITGDLFDKRRKPEGAEELIKALKGLVPIYYISGNHEFQNKKQSICQMKTFLIDQGVNVLENESVLLDNELQIIGIEDCLQFPAGSEFDQEKEVIDRIFNDCYDQSWFNLVLIHRPDHHLQFKEYEIDLMLSGHAHGGQWRIPGILNGLIAPQQGFFPKRAGGQYLIHGGIQIVSRGLGAYLWLPRFLNRPEMIFIELEKVS